MNTQETNPGTGHAHERCLCCEFVEFVQTRLGVPPEVQRHLTNSRVELLKAIREMIDKRIEHLSKPQQQGTNIPVE